MAVVGTIERAMRSLGRSKTTFDTDEKSLTYLLGVLSETRSEIGRADQKAAILLATAGVGIGALIGGALSGQWSPEVIPDSIEWLWWAGVGACVLGVLTLAGALYPRSRAKPPSARPGRVYLSDFTDKATSTAILERDSLGEAARERVDLIADQIRRLGVIVDKKYALIRRGMLFLLGSFGCCVLSVIIGRVVG